MATILEQINGIAIDANAYKFGQISAVYENSIDVELTSGLLVKINSAGESYVIGDQLVLGVSDANLNNLFILKKIDRTYPSAINYVVNLDED